ncbi:LacI family DNA-binding transcriptional regulator [Streptomyces albus]|nr:LacI family DNA-binding transcriptional regulator [Streptomyces albus]
MGSGGTRAAGGPARPTSKDVARLAGVSHTAVSFVFNGRAEGNLSAATQQRIRQAAEQLGYRPNAVARGLRRSRTAVIGLVTDHIASSPFAGALLRGAMETAWDQGHLVLTVDSTGDPAKENAAVAELLDRRVDGIIYAAMSLRTAHLPEGLERTTTVLANCLPADGTHAAVIPAERGRRPGRHPAAPRRGAPPDRGGGRPRRHRHRRTAARLPRRPARAGLHAPKEWTRREGGEISAGYRAAVRLLDGVPAAERPTGIVCYNDRVAAGVLHAAARLGLDVPADLSLVGYDDQEHMAAFLTPALTTVALPHRAMGERAARLLLDALAAQAAPPAEVVRLECPVVGRASVAAPATRS